MRTPHGTRTTRVTIEGAETTIGPSGFPVETFTDLVPEVWARHLAGGPSTEREAAGQLVAQIGAEWRIAYRPDCDPDLVDVPRVRRLRVNGRVLEIVAAETLGRKAEIRLVTHEKVTGA